MPLIMHDYKYKGWNIICKPEDLYLFDAIRSKKYKKGKKLKKNHRSLVKVVDIKERQLVLKVPKEQNKRAWIRFTSLFRKSQAYRDLQGMLIYKEMGVPSTEPVMAAEKRKYGMVVKSWLLYKYLKGESCLDQTEFYPAVIDTLKSIHKKGYLHGDAQIRNFLHKEHGQDIYVIDSNPKPAGITGFNKYYEFAYLKRSAPGIDLFFGKIKGKWLYKFAERYDRYEREFVRNRRKIKKLILSPFNSS